MACSAACSRQAKVILCHVGDCPELCEGIVGGMQEKFNLDLEYSRPHADVLTTVKNQCSQVRSEKCKIIFVLTKQFLNRVWADSDAKAQVLEVIFDMADYCTTVWVDVNENDITCKSSTLAEIEGVKMEIDNQPVDHASLCQAIYNCLQKGTTEPKSSVQQATDTAEAPLTVGASTNTGPKYPIQNTGTEGACSLPESNTHQILNVSDLTQDIRDELASYLDRDSPTLKNWRNLASYLGYDRLISTWELAYKAMGSPTKQLLEHDASTRNCSISQLKEHLKKMQRKDALDALAKYNL